MSSTVSTHSVSLNAKSCMLAMMHAVGIKFSIRPYDDSRNITPDPVLFVYIQLDMPPLPLCYSEVPSRYCRTYFLHVRQAVNEAASSYTIAELIITVDLGKRK